MKGTSRLGAYKEQCKKKILSKIKKLFCRHHYTQIGFVEACENNIRYSQRHYRCDKCSKAIWADGRFDPYHR